MNNCNNCNTEENGAITRVYLVPVTNYFYGFTADEMILQVQNGLSKYSIYNRKEPDFILMHPKTNLQTKVFWS